MPDVVTVAASDDSIGAKCNGPAAAETATEDCQKKGSQVGQVHREESSRSGCCGEALLGGEPGWLSSLEAHSGNEGTVRGRIEVHSVVVDMCKFGLRGPGGGLHKKSTRLLTSSAEVYKELSATPRCSGDHWHEPVIGGARITELAPRNSEAVIRGARV